MSMSSLKDGRIETDLYIKPTDRNQYLLPNSCHPRQTTLAIPKSFAIRISRICSNPNVRDKRLPELQERLLKRGYKKDNILSAFTKARRIPREELLKKVSQKKENKRPVFATPYDPRLPSIPSLQIKHWRS